LNVSFLDLTITLTHLTMPSAAPILDVQLPAHPPDLSKGLPKLTARRPQPEQRSSNPPPPTPPLPDPPQLEGHQYFSPSRRILSERDHQLFLASETDDLIVSFVFKLSDSVRNVTITQAQADDSASDPAITALLAVLDEADAALKSCPPLDTGSRFGNPAFRDFLGMVESNATSWHEQLGVTDADAQAEISTYLMNSFGNGTRIDYGSGHELNFLLWLLCLRQLSVIKDSTFTAIVLVVLPRYLLLMRDVQSTYYLEPAGSHGVWGLDDYQFLPFLFGASQLVGHKHIRPLSIHNEMTVDECKKDYLYLDQIAWVNSTKTVQGLRWHSPMLDDISSSKNWAKIEAGMRKMFLAEVLGKLPVAQHFLFGSLLPAAEGMSEDAESKIDDEQVGEYEVTVDGMKHIHSANSWGDCCGIKVPSALGANLEARKTGEGSELRRIPFD
jgi:serine/threonine-protein phosphatase 2A activator